MMRMAVSHSLRTTLGLARRSNALPTAGNVVWFAPGLPELSGGHKPDAQWPTARSDGYVAGEHSLKRCGRHKQPAANTDGRDFRRFAASYADPREIRRITAASLSVTTRPSS